MFMEELEDLKNRYLSRLTLHLRVLAGSAPTCRCTAAGSTAPRSASSCGALVDRPRIDHAFVCGPHGVNDEAEAALLAAGVAPERIHIERFGIPDESRPGRARRAGAARRRRRRCAHRHRPRRRHAARSTSTPRQGNVLDAAAAAGLDVPFSCKSGVCCTCRAKLLEGEVRMARNFALEKHEVAAGFVLTCQSHPLTERVVLSLRRALSMPRGRARGYDRSARRSSRAPRSCSPERLHRDVDERGRRGVRRLQALALSLRPRQAPAAGRDRRDAHRAPARRWSPRSTPARWRPRRALRRLIDAFLAAYAGAQAEHRVLTEDVRFLRRPSAARARRRSARWSPRSPTPSPRRAPSCAAAASTSRSRCCCSA